MARVLDDDAARALALRPRGVDAARLRSQLPWVGRSGLNTGANVDAAARATKVSPITAK